MITVRCSSGDEAYAESLAGASLAAHTLLADACVADSGASQRYTARFVHEGRNYRVVLSRAGVRQLLAEAAA